MYPSNINDKQFKLIKKYFEKKTSNKGRPKKHTSLTILNAIFYVLRTGCQWKMLPIDFPPWKTVYHYFRLWKKSGLFGIVHSKLRDEIRKRNGKEKTPSAMIVDSQSVKRSYQTESSGYDAGKKIKGIKRHILVDTLGLIWAIVVLPASIQDREGCFHLLSKLEMKLPRMRLIWADAGYSGVLIECVQKLWGWILEIIKRTDTGFKILPKRWIVERTFSWFEANRRLSKDYEKLSTSSEAFVHLSMIRLMLNRL